MRFDYAMELFEAASQETQNAEGRMQNEDEPAVIGPAGFVHAPGMSRLIRMMGGK